MDIRSLSAKVSSSFVSHGKRLKGASRFVRLVLLVCGAAIAGIAQFAEFSPQGPTAWQIAGIAASVAVAIGALFATVIDEDVSEQLSLAHEALSEARDLQEKYQDLSQIENEFEKASGLLSSHPTSSGRYRAKYLHGFHDRREAYQYRFGSM